MTAKRHCNNHRSPLLPSSPRQDLPRSVNAVIRVPEQILSQGTRRYLQDRSKPEHYRVTKIMSFLSLLVAIFVAITACRASAQVIPILRLPTRISDFGTFTDAKPSFRYWGDRAVWGHTLGGIAQLPRMGGVELRGSMPRH
jgi:hypothetical protein